MSGSPRPADALEFAHEAVPLDVTQRELGHRNLGVTSIYLEASTSTRSSTPSTALGSR